MYTHVSACNIGTERNEFEKTREMEGGEQIEKRVVPFSLVTGLFYFCYLRVCVCKVFIPNLIHSFKPSSSFSLHSVSHTLFSL